MLIIIRLFPLTVILTPATLTVASLTEIKEDRCSGVRTLNFELEKTKNWRIEERINGLRVLSLSLYNSTVPNSDTMVGTPFNETFFDYWTGLSPPAELVADQSALTGAIIPRRDATVETCGGGWNCSYTISFKAPGYKCSLLARGQTLDEDALRRQGALIRTSLLAPMGDYSYIASTDQGEYFNHQTNVSIGGAPIMQPPYPKHLGVLRTEPALMIGYSVATRPGNNLPKDKTVPGWDTAFEAIVFRCEHYLTSYTVQFNHTFSQQNATVLKREYLYPIINTTFVPDKNAEDGTYDNTTATPEANYVFPLDFENYRLIAACHSIGRRMRSYLEGFVQIAPYPMVESGLTKTNLINTDTYVPVPDLMTEIRNLYENMTLSLLSNPQFAVVSWAADPSRRSGTSNATAPADPALSWPCVKTRVANAYVYNRRDLWLAYAVAIGAACFAVVLGSAALGQNNFHVRDVHVSSIVAATRAPCLEDLPWKASKWGEVSDEILDYRLGYGVVAEAGPNGTPAAAAMGPGWLGSPRVVSGKVYYGFAPREVLERTRVATFGPGKARSRASAFSFRTWEQNYSR